MKKKLLLFLALLMLIPLQGNVYAAKKIEKKIYIKDVEKTGEDERYFQIVNGVYTLTKSGKIWQIDLRIKLDAKFEQDYSAEVFSFKIVPLDNRGEEIGYNYFLPTSQDEFNKITSLLDGEVGEEVTVSFKLNEREDGGIAQMANIQVMDIYIREAFDLGEFAKLFNEFKLAQQKKNITAVAKMINFPFFFSGVNDFPFFEKISTEKQFIEEGFSLCFEHSYGNYFTIPDYIKINDNTKLNKEIFLKRKDKYNYTSYYVDTRGGIEEVDIGEGEDETTETVTYDCCVRFEIGSGNKKFSGLKQIYWFFKKFPGGYKFVGYGGGESC